MKIEDLKIISAVFSEPNLSKISEQFHVTQSSLSKIIRRIESEVGVTLFERKGFQGLKPTPQGLLFAERVRLFSRSWEDTLYLVKNFDQTRQELKVTGPSLYMRNVFFPVWFSLKLYEKFRVTYVQSRIDQISNAAQAGDIDLVITPSPFELKEWIPTKIFKEKFALFYGGPKEFLSLEELGLERKTWIAYRAANDILQSFFHRHQLSMDQVAAFIDDVETILDILQTDSHALAVLPAHASGTHRELHRLELGEESGQNLFLMYRQGPAGLSELAKILRKNLPMKAE